VGDTQYPPGPQSDDLADYGKLAVQETLRCDGVTGMHKGVADRLGMRKISGVAIRRDKEDRLHLDISIIVKYGTDLRKLGSDIQNAVVRAIAQESAEPVAQINVVVADIEFAGQGPTNEG